MADHEEKGVNTTKVNSDFKLNAIIELDFE